MQEMPQRTRDTIAKYLRDMHSLETHGHQAISRQETNLQGTSHTEALSAVQEFKRTLESHISALEARMQALGISTSSPVQDAASAVAGVAAGLYNKVRSEEASKSIRDDYTFFSHVNIAYLMLHTTAKGLGDDQTASLAERGYRDAANMVMRIDDLMPGLVLNELRQGGAQVMDVEQECRKLISDAWNGAAKGAGLGRQSASAGARSSGSTSRGSA